MSSLNSPPTSSSESSPAADTFSTHQATRPLPFVHPTRAVFAAHPRPPSESSVVGAHWSARSSRKNRYLSRPLAVKPHLSVVLEQRLHHAHARFKLHLAWDLSFWVAQVFVLGSALWVINAFLLYLPLLDVGPAHPDAAAWCAFAGGTFFEVGSYLMVVEALNTGHEQMFGPALWGLVSGENFDSEMPAKPVQFRWYGVGSWRELGFLACFIQMIAATVFWISTITGIPDVIHNLNTDPPTAITDVFFWTPQVVGGTGFFISSLFLMLEVQRTWWIPNIGSLGWHIGLWNLIGAVGFTLCGALGYAAATSTKANYQSVLSTFWGSWAFLIGSTIQLWETLWREDPTAPAPSSPGREKGS
ncbi:hypothetical protein SCP_0604640 [Sparassis crispa]|uniref:Integral membrane protein n=1 Tax=Sparassis crispa TaxID=139825 RepID=A0A401GQK6_9APHY|nr:hypothetical protein SCP_0604640 [Sparassis crispa]GBE84485.1 hypothetical protein SCP_0604640 [Sparassis crispa]